MVNNFCKHMLFTIIDFHNTFSFASFKFDRAKRKATNMHGTLTHIGILNVMRHSFACRVVLIV